MEDKSPALNAFDGYFSSFDGLRLFYRYYSAGSQAETLVILHGQGEHSGRYQKFARYLSGENLSLAILDLRGHGRSEGRLVYVNSFHEYIDDVSCFYRWICRTHGAKDKILLHGHSLGGLIGIYWAKENPANIKGLSLSSPCLGIKLPKSLVVMNEFLNGCIPRFCYNNPIYPPHLTHDPAEIQRYKEDPLIHRKITVRLLHEMLNCMHRLDKEVKIVFDFPVSVLEAGDEKVVDPAKIKTFFEKIHAARKELKILPGFYHEIFNEIAQAEAFEALRDCLRKSMNDQYFVGPS